jgi:uncharacterized membrane protein (DUF2068 family)
MDTEIIEKLFTQDFSTVEKKLKQATTDNPSLVLGTALCAGMALGFLGVKKLTAVGAWLATQDKSFYSKIFQSLQDAFPQKGSPTVHA